MSEERYEVQMWEKVQVDCCASRMELRRKFSNLDSESARSYARVKTQKEWVLVLRLIKATGKADVKVTASLQATVLPLPVLSPSETPSPQVQKDLLSSGFFESDNVYSSPEVPDTERFISMVGGHFIHPDVLRVGCSYCRNGLEDMDLDGAEGWHLYQQFKVLHVSPDNPMEYTVFCPTCMGKRRMGEI